MPRSRGRKSRPQKPAPPHTRSQPQPPIHADKSTWDKIRDYPIPWVIGLVAALIAVGTTVWQIFAEPTIDLAGDATLPFRTPFAVKNESFVFAMYDAQISCIADNINMGRLAISALNFAFDNKQFSQEQLEIFSAE